uniref:Protein kinase domain-containing protein n=1 Tax=Chenopodium quinoa TaxID=63459 RepID=A0A803L388_CHEQI
MATIDDIVSYNPTQIQNKDVLRPNTRIRVPIPCGCVDDTFLGHIFSYMFQKGDTYYKVAKYNYSNVTTWDWIEQFNSYNRFNVPDEAMINVPVNCSCGNSRVSKDYGLFITYPLQFGESLRSISQEFNLSESLLQGYNPGVNFSAGTGLVYIPGRDKNGNYPPLVISRSASGLAAGAIAGICLAAVGLIALSVWFYLRYKRNKDVKEASRSEKPGYQLTHSMMQAIIVCSSLHLAEHADFFSKGGDTADDSGVYSNSVEYSYKELAKATENFNSSYVIGAGGFGEVYLGKLRGEAVAKLLPLDIAPLLPTSLLLWESYIKKAAIKKMDMQASKEFFAELQVLTRVHHLHLVRLLGYCVEGSLFLVYEFIDNGNLSQHLHGSARGLEYIHEHTNPVYIHRDIKSANILISKNFRAKVADFGLAKLAEFENSTLPTRLVGTFGYMPPEYAQFGEVTPKVDVFAFGVVLYELISAKPAIVRENNSVAESRSLVALFEDVPNHPDPNEICKLIDPNLGDDYPLDSVRQVAELAKACTHENPELRPSMKSVVVALMTLSSATETWDIDFFHRNIGLLNQVSGR